MEVNPAKHTIDFTNIMCFMFIFTVSVQKKIEENSDWTLVKRTINENCNMLRE